MSDVFDRLLANHELAPRTVSQYMTVLRYWAEWHRLRFGTPLALSRMSPVGVDSNVVNDFIDDHLAIVSNGRVSMKMEKSIVSGLRGAGYNVHVECVAPRTTEFRLNVLHKLHRIMGLPFEIETVRKSKAFIYAAWEAESAVLGISRDAPMSASNTVNALLGVCGADREGVRDVALVLFLCRATPSQVAELRFFEVYPGTIRKDGEEQDAVEFLISHPINDRQKFEPKVRFVGVEATLIKAWGALREDEVHQKKDLFFVGKFRNWNTSPALNPSWITARIHHLSQAAGIAGTRGCRTISPQWLRKAHEIESIDDSHLIKVARAIRVTPRSVIRMTRRTRRHL